MVILSNFNNSIIYVLINGELIVKLRINAFCSISSLHEGALLIEIKVYFDKISEFKLMHLMQKKEDRNVCRSGTGLM